MPAMAAIVRPADRRPYRDLAVRGRTVGAVPTADAACLARLGSSQATSTMHLDLDRGVQRQLGHPDRAAGVPAGLAEDRAEELAAPLITAGLAGEPGAEATKPTTFTTLTTFSRPTSASIAASALSAHRCGQLLGLLGGDLGADLAGGQQLAVGDRELAGDVHVVAGLHGRHVRGHRRRHRRAASRPSSASFGVRVSRSSMRLRLGRLR